MAFWDSISTKWDDTVATWNDTSLPENPTVELFLNSAWVNVTPYVYYRDMIAITRGRSGEGARTDTSTCRFTLNNRDGRFSPRNPTGIYYGQLVRNTPVRVSVNGGLTYARMPGGSSDRITTPDTAALDITGDIDVRIEFSFDEAPEFELAGKFQVSGNQQSWLLYLTDAGNVAFRWSANGSTTIEKQSTARSWYRGIRYAVRVTLDVDDGSGNNVVTYYVSDSINGEWEAFDSDTTAGTTSVFASTAQLELGEISNLLSEPLDGRIYAFELRDGIDGTVVANPDFTSQTAGNGSFTDGSGLTWTMEGESHLSNRKERFSGEISSYGVNSDISGKDATVTIEASGIMRRLSQGSVPLDSVLRSLIKGSNAIECYPLTDGELSTKGTPFNSSFTMTPSLSFGTELPSWSAGELNPWTENVMSPALDTDGTMRGYLPQSTSADTGWSVDFFFSGLREGSLDLVVADIGAGTDTDNRIGFSIEIEQGSDRIRLFITAAGETSSSSTLLTTISSPDVFDDDAHHVRLTAVPASPNTIWTLYVDGVSAANGSHGLLTRRLLFARPGWSLNGATKGFPCFGYVTYWGVSAQLASTMFSAVSGYKSETAGARIERNTGEKSIAYQRIGDDTTTDMGPQNMITFLDVLRAGEDADLGFLYEPREFNGHTYRDRVSLYNQEAHITLDYSQGQLSAPLVPVEDDQNTRNDVTASQEYGTVYRAVLESGTLSVQEPPNGVGRYEGTSNVSLNDTEDVPDYANWVLHLGTVDEARYPTISLNLRHSTFTGSAALMESALSLDIGDRIVIVNPPSWLPPDNIEILAVGFFERLGVRERDIVVNCVPASPYNVAVADAERYNHADTGGSTLTSAVTSSATSFEVTTQTGSQVWVHSIGYPDSFPFDVKTGGEIMTVLGIGASGLILNTNPSFETGTTAWTATNATIEQSSDFSRSGTYSCKLTSGAGASPRAEDTQRAVTAGQNYTAAGWLYAPSTLPTDATVSVNWYDSGSSYLSTSSTTTTLTAGEWTPVSGSFTAPVSSAFAGVHFSITGTPGSGHIMYADNVVILDDTKTDTSSPQLFHLIRSVNGVVKSHSSGADIRLAYPAIVAL